MFICNGCYEARGETALQASRSHGNCEFCGRRRDCWDIPSRALLMDHETKNFKGPYPKHLIRLGKELGYWPRNYNPDLPVEA